MHPVAERLAAQWITDFWSANQDITWRHVEREMSMQLNDNTILVGKVDAEGVTGDGDPFFGEWKTASEGKWRYRENTKATFLRAPQPLTYGVLMYPIKRFTVRWAFKTTPARTDFEWYHFNPGEIDHWRRQIIQIADEIRAWRICNQPWRTNYHNCYRYGVNYACPFIGSCPLQTAREGPPRVYHLALEDGLRKANPDPHVVILDATRIGLYLECPEKYRRLWEGPGLNETSEDLDIGHDFHDIVGAHLATRIGRTP